MALTSAGLEIETYSSILARVQASWRADFGDDFDVSSDGDAMRLVLPFINQIDDLWQLQQQLYDSFSRSNAQDIQLDNLAQVVGVVRDDGTQSTGQITITGDAGAIIPERYVVRSSVTASLFETSDSGVLPDTAAPAGTEVLTLAIVSQEVAAVTASIGTLTEQISVVTGVASVTNAAAITPGRARQLDPALRDSMATELQGAGAGTSGALYTAVLAVEAVQATVVINNTSDVVDANGVPAHGARVVVWPTLVDTDDQLEVANVLAQQQGGARFDGTEEFTGTTLDGQTAIVRYSYATSRELRWKAVVTTGTGYPSNGDTLVQETIAKFFGLIDIEGGDEITRYAVAQDILVQEVLCAIIRLVPCVRAVALAVDDVATDPPLITTILPISSTEVGEVTDILLIVVTS